MHYKVLSTQRLIVDGQTIEAGRTVAQLKTNLPLGNVLSSLAFGTLTCQPVDESDTVEVIDRANVGADAVVGKPTKSEPQSADVDPDSLNDADADEDSKLESQTSTSGASTNANDKTSPPTTEPDPPALDPSFEGLDARLARALTTDERKLSTRDAVAKFVADGGDLLDVDGIGKKTKPVVLKWLGLPTE